MKYRKLKYPLATSAIVVAFVLNGCAAYTPEEEGMIASVVTALPTEVEGCTFIGDVANNYGAVSLASARNQIKLQAAQLGANHVVETNMGVSPGMFFYRDGPFIAGPSGYTPDQFYLAGRAYICPEGKGVKTLPRPQKKSEMLKSDPESLPNTPAVDESADSVHVSETYDESNQLDDAKPAAVGAVGKK